MAAASSSGRPSRPEGMRARSAARASSGEAPAWRARAAATSANRSVSMEPGAATFTVTPSGATSSESAFSHPTAASRREVESARSGMGWRTLVDSMAITLPHRRDRMPGRAARTSLTVERRVSGTARAHASSSSEEAVPRGGPPQFATRTSTRPSLAPASSTRRRGPSGPARSAATQIAGGAPEPARRARASTASAARRSRSSLRPESATDAPSSASTAAAASPRPPLDAATTAAFPRRPRSMPFPFPPGSGSRPGRAARPGRARGPGSGGPPGTGTPYRMRDPAPEGEGRNPRAQPGDQEATEGGRHGG